MIQYVLFQQNKDGSLWQSDASFEAATTQEVAQEVIAGALIGEPRWAETETGEWLYGLDAKGLEIHARPPKVVPFDTALDTFVSRLQAMLDAHREKNCPNIPRYVVECQPGVRYVRVVTTQGIGHTAYCFVDKGSGDVLKPDGWKRPAKGLRGTIYADQLPTACGPYGIERAR